MAQYCIGTLRPHFDGQKLWMCYCDKCETHTPNGCEHSAVYETRLCECCQNSTIEKSSHDTNKSENQNTKAKSEPLPKELQMVYFLRTMLNENNEITQPKCQHCKDGGEFDEYGLKCKKCKEYI